MRVIHGLESVQFSGVVLTIGNFDGVHLGHQAILAAARKRADNAKTQLVAMTFHPHPLAILTPEHVPAPLTLLDTKLHYLQNAGADIVVLIKSRPEFLRISADEFITEVIIKRFDPVAIVEGPSFCFGHHRQGDVETLAAAAAYHHFQVEVVQPVRVPLGGPPDAVISSSLIRQLVRAGAVDQAALCLGRPFTLFGRVTYGAGRGGELGFHTANLLVDQQLVPAEGVYAARSRLEHQTHPAAASIGRCQTFDGHDVVIEAHLLDFDGDLYDKPIGLEFLEWIRPQQRFDSSEALKKAISADIARVREIIAKYPADG